MSPTLRILPTSLAALACAALLSPGPTAAQTLPPDGEGAVAALEASPSHGEWVKYDAGGGDMVEAWVVYPERSDAAPVVVVIHEIFGMSDWIRAVADRLAAEGFIAIAPDMLSGKGPGGGGTSSFDSQEVGRAIRDLDRGEINRQARGRRRVRPLPPGRRRSGGCGRLLLGRLHELAAGDGLGGSGRRRGLLRHVAGERVRGHAGAGPRALRRERQPGGRDHPEGRGGHGRPSTRRSSRTSSRARGTASCVSRAARTART